MPSTLTSAEYDLSLPLIRSIHGLKPFQSFSECIKFDALNFQTVQPFGNTKFVDKKKKKQNGSQHHVVKLLSSEIMVQNALFRLNEWKKLGNNTWQ